MLKHTLIFLILVVAISSAIPPDIPQLNPDEGVLFDSLPEDAYERGRVCVSEFLDSYLDDYSLGDAEPFYAYGYGLEQIALAFIFATHYDSISWTDFYKVDAQYLQATDLAIENALSVSPDDPLITNAIDLNEELKKYNVVVVAFVDNKPVVLSCSLIDRTFTKSTSITEPGIIRLGYIIRPIKIIYSGDDDEIIIRYTYGKLYKDENNDTYFMGGYGIDYDFNNYEDLRKPRYYEIWGIRNTLAGPVCTSFD
ncbi:hypothetical protein KAU45_02635 [bacterium]|nr:hypothetical protein [bacterium]